MHGRVEAERDVGLRGVNPGFRRRRWRDDGCWHRSPGSGFVRPGRDLFGRACQTLVPAAELTHEEMVECTKLPERVGQVFRVRIVAQQADGVVEGLQFLFRRRAEGAGLGARQHDGRRKHGRLRRCCAGLEAERPEAVDDGLMLVDHHGVVQVEGQRYPHWFEIFGPHSEQLAEPVRHGGLGHDPLRLHGMG